MKGDIFKAKPGSVIPTPRHDHKWFFLTTKNAFEPREDGAYDMVEYAYMICNGCTTVIKEKVKLKNE